MLYAVNGKSALEPSVFLRMFTHLPSLRNLCVSNFDANAFGDSTLVCLPPLESLRLENLAGVTDSGLSQYCATPEARSLKSLSLIEPNLDSLLILSKIFSSLPLLERFTIVQTNKNPSLSEADIVFQPFLASSSLKHMHWDISSPYSAVSLSKFDSNSLQKTQKGSRAPNFLLAQSILAAGFPQLETLRAPSDIDPVGVLQGVCRPIPKGQALLASDRYGLPRGSHGSGSSRGSALPAGNSLSSARIRAQTLMDIARDSDTGTKFVITDYSDSYVPDFPEDASSFEEDEEEDEGDEGQQHQEETRGKIDDVNFEEEGSRQTEESQREDNQIQTPHNHEDIEGPVILHEFRLPAFVGRAGTRDVLQNVSIPHFIIQPDVPGTDIDGGLTGWKHLLCSSQSLKNHHQHEPDTTNDNRSSSSLSPIEERPISPSSGGGGANRLGRTSPGTGTSGNRSTMVSSPVTTTPPTGMGPSNASIPPWEKDVCTGAWNSKHKNGKDWWYHVERDRPASLEIPDVRMLF